MKDKNTKFVISFFQSLNVVGYNYKNVPFETTRLIEFLPDGFEHTVCVFCTHQKSKMTVTGGDTRVV
jgi:hypothetical protein